MYSCMGVCVIHINVIFLFKIYLIRYKCLTKYIKKIKYKSLNKIKKFLDQGLFYAVISYKLLLLYSIILLKQKKNLKNKYKIFVLIGLFLC